jgi:anaerobic magnesium-protoporphyrin IX monomethyl ester cyclase
MSDIDLILICQSNILDLGGLKNVPFDRPELFTDIVYPRAAYHKGGFRNHLDIINDWEHGEFYDDASYARRREILNIWNLPSASGLHIANLLLHYDLRVHIVNNIDSEFDLFQRAYESCSRPPLVGISSTFYLSYKEIGRVSKMIRSVDADADIVLGGAFSNAETINGSVADFETPMRKYGIRYVLHAFNSEHDLRTLVETRKSGGDLETIANLCYIDGAIKTGTFHATGSSWQAPVLNETPANWHRIEAPFLNRTIQIRTASGCPFACSFCSYPTTAGGWKVMNDDVVRAHLDSIKKLGTIDKIIFIDDTFNVPPHRFKDLLKIFSEYDFEWFSFLRVQYVDDDVVRMMRESGCRGVYLGFESANDQILKNMNKRAKRANFEKGLELLNKHGIESLAAFIIGFPGETDETIADNLRFIEDNGVGYYSLKEFFYIKHTSIHEQRETFGLTGMGGNWKHDTMDSKTATQIKHQMFRQIKNSISIDPDISLWYMAYLYDQGYSFDKIATLQKDINAMMQRQMDGDFSETRMPLKTAV